MNMNEELLSKLVQEKDECRKMLPEIKKAIKKAPEGTLHILNAKGKYPQYYLYDKGWTGQCKNGRFIQRKDNRLAQRLAQKQYDIDVAECLERKIRSIERFLKEYEANNVMSVYEQMTEQRKALVEPVVLPDEEYVRVWKNTMRGNANEYQKNVEIYTDTGERVRSKSEKILADRFGHEGIPYIYEPELVFKDGTRVYPDFALLQLRTRRTIYFEHFGMMDSLEYCTKALKKIETYSKNDYWFGENLLYTFETKEEPLNIKNVDRMIHKFFTKYL
ncbi:MAG: hypothetical protein PUC30_12815 [Lachnospiraceae bacterium]|nr:hypothetical protein [Lachnospiraceae bacterium]